MWYKFAKEEKQPWEMTLDEFIQHPGTIYHGARDNYKIETSKGMNTTGNPTSNLGAFFTPNRNEAQRYVDDFHGGKGKVNYHALKGQWLPVSVAR